MTGFYMKYNPELKWVKIWALLGHPNLPFSVKILENDLENIVWSCTFKSI